MIGQRNMRYAVRVREKVQGAPGLERWVDLGFSREFDVAEKMRDDALADEACISVYIIDQPLGAPISVRYREGCHAGLR